MSHFCRKVLVTVAIIVTFNLFLFICVTAQDTVPHPEFPAWTYSGSHGPEYWGDISEQFELCRTGQSQSPIDISFAEASDLEAIRFNYYPTKLTVEDIGYSIQVNYDEGSTITFDNHTYMLKRIVIHAPSEHSIQGKQYAMEFQLVHEDAFGRTAIISIMGERGQHNPSLRGVLNAISVLRSEPRTILGVTFNASAMLPEDRAYYSYMGSLTTPPCTEGVRWLVLQTPIQLSRSQITDFEARFGLNARPIQATNGRGLSVSSASAGA